MKKRIAYVGLSTPMLFDYDNQAKKTVYDTNFGSPNPVLYSPFGLMLLYDEIWFFCESLCPENMRGLDYIKFVTNIVDSSIIDELANQAYSIFLNTDNAIELSNSEYDELMSLIYVSGNEYLLLAKYLSQNGINPMPSHGFLHKIKIKDRYFHVTDSDFNCIFDLLLLIFLEVEIELICSSENQYLAQQGIDFSEASMTEKLIIGRIPRACFGMHTYEYQASQIMMQAS